MQRASQKIPQICATKLSRGDEHGGISAAAISRGQFLNILNIRTRQNVQIGIILENSVDNFVYKILKVLLIVIFFTSVDLTNVLITLTIFCYWIHFQFP